MEEKPKILIVEDEKAHAEALAEGLKRSGYKCTLAGQGFKAVSLLAEETFDLVKDFIEKTKSDEQKVDVTDMTASEEVVTIGSA